MGEKKSVEVNLKAHKICLQLLVMVRKKHCFQFSRHLMNSKYIQNTVHTEGINISSHSEAYKLVGKKKNAQMNCKIRYNVIYSVIRTVVEKCKEGYSFHEVCLI